jgi:DNA invertase Pin-like site-specific DNA recombinase
MSEAELHILKARMRGGQLNKARRGELEMGPPVGLVGPTRISSCDAVLDFYLRRVSAAFVAVSLIRCCPIVSCRL